MSAHTSLATKFAICRRRFIDSYMPLQTRPSFTPPYHVCRQSILYAVIIPRLSRHIRATALPHITIFIDFPAAIITPSSHTHTMPISARDIEPIYDDAIHAYAYADIATPPFPRLPAFHGDSAASSLSLMLIYRRFHCLRRMNILLPPAALMLPPARDIATR